MEGTAVVIIEPLGDCGLLVEFGDEVNENVQQKVTAFSKLLSESSIEGIIEFIPSYTTVTIFYNPFYFLDPKQKSPFIGCKQMVQHLLKKTDLKTNYLEDKTVVIPVCYGGEYGPDLEAISKMHKINIDEVINIHSDTIYTVAMIGFAPGFPYLIGLNKQIATPRRTSPRKSVPKGSVGIAGVQTGIYSISSPGGWQIIGRTPITLFEHKKAQPSLLQQGDKVRFERMTETQFKKWGGAKDECSS